MNNFKNCSGRLHTAAGTGLSMSKAMIAATACSLLLSVTFFSCGPSKEEMEYKERSVMVADSVAQYMPGLATDTIDRVTHNFIRNASMKCRVSDVQTAILAIEDIVAVNGGYASKSDLSSQVNYHTSIRFAKDSVMDQAQYITVSTMTLRIPNQQLDTVLRKISGMSVFMDYRALRSDDVKLKLYANSLKEARLKEYKQRVQAKSDAVPAKLNQAVAAEEQALNSQAQSDETRVSSYDLADQVNNSTLVLELYDTEKTTVVKRAAPAVIEAYEPPFTDKLATAFDDGFRLLKRFMLFIASCWSIFFIVLALFFASRTAVSFYNRHLAAGSK